MALAVLPLGLMFASFGPLWFFAAWLSGVFGIPLDAPVKDQPRGLFWLIIFLVVMIILMIVGYLLGWLLNAAIVRFFFGWPAEKVQRVFFYSEVPPSWRKESTLTSDKSLSTSSQNSAWATTRRKGKWHFVLSRGVLAWGVPMYVVMACLPVLNHRVEATVFYFLWQAGLWGAAGALFGSVVWHFSEKQFKKQSKHQKP